MILLNHIGTDVIEIWLVVLKLHNVVIALYKNKSTIKPPQKVTCLPWYNHITTHVHTIFRCNECVVVRDDRFIVLLDCTEWAERGSVVTLEGENILMA